MPKGGKGAAKSKGGKKKKQLSDSDAEKSDAAMSDLDNVDFDDIDLDLSSDEDEDQPKKQKAKKKEKSSKNKGKGGKKGKKGAKNKNDSDDSSESEEEEEEAEEEEEEDKERDEEAEKEELEKQTKGMTEIEREEFIYDLENKKLAETERKNAKSKSKQLKSKGSAKERRTSKRAQDANTETRERHEALADLMARKSRSDAGLSSKSKLNEDDDEDEEIDLVRKRAKRRREDDDEEERMDDDEDKSKSVTSAPSGTSSADKEKERERDKEREKERDKERARRESISKGRKSALGYTGERTPLRLDDMLLIQLRRNLLEKLFEEPYFNEYVLNKFARITVGARDDGSMSYRCCAVAGIEEDKPYKFGSKITSMYLRLQIGKSERLFAMNVISNASITEEEMNKWKAEMEKAGKETICAEEAYLLKSTAEKLKQNFKYTEEMISKIVEEKRSKSVLLSRPAVDKFYFESQLMTARQKGDVDAIALNEKRLLELKEIVQQKQKKAAEMFAENKFFDASSVNARAKAFNQTRTIHVIENDAFARRETRPQLESRGLSKPAVKSSALLKVLADTHTDTHTERKREREGHTRRRRIGKLALLKT